LLRDEEGKKLVIGAMKTTIDKILGENFHDELKGNKIKMDELSEELKKEILESVNK